MVVDHEWKEIYRMQPSQYPYKDVQWECRRCGDKWWTRDDQPPTRAQYPTDCNDTIIRKVTLS